MRSSNRNYRKKISKQELNINRPLPIKRLRTILFCGVIVDCGFVENISFGHALAD